MPKKFKFEGTQKSCKVINFDKDYLIELSKNLEIITNHLLFESKDKNKIKRMALKLFNATIENGMSPSDLSSKNTGVLSIVFVYFSLLNYGYIKINKNPLSYGTLCRLLGKDLKLIGLSDSKSRSVGKVANFLPKDLKEKYKVFYSRKLYTGRLSFEQFINSIKKLGFDKIGIEGKALNPHFKYNELDKKEYQELTSEEYYDLIKNKKGTEVRIPVWCGKNDHPPWEGILSNILQGKWCRICADEEKITFSFEKLKETAKKRGLEENGVEGKILNSKNNNEELTQEIYNRLIKKKRPSKTHFWWSCNINGHLPWRTTPSHIEFDKTWCPICKMGLYTHAELIKLAKQRGYEETGLEGKILRSKNSNKELTKDTYEKLTAKKKASKVSFWWSCENNHPPFRNNPANIRRGQWCPICSSEGGKFANIIRWYFERIFSVSFPEIYLRDLNLNYTKMNINLDFLRKKNVVKLVGYKVDYDNQCKFQKYNGKMRFDGYAEITINGRMFRIVFEYNGIQHYEFPNYWFGESADRLNSWLSYIKRDQIKKEICKLNNIILIEFPYYIDIALEHPKRIQSFITKQFELKSGIKLNINENFNHKKD